MRSLWLTLALVACSKDKSAPPPAPAPAAEAPKPAPAAEAQTKQMIPSKDVGTLVARLHYEAAHRPTVALPSEKVLDALEAAGVHVNDRKQYLGMSMHAPYCYGGTTPEGIAISLCEYNSDKDASDAKAFADKQYAAIPHLRRLTKGSTLIGVGGEGPIADKAVETFSKL